MNPRTLLDCRGKRSATPLSLVNRLRQALPPKRRRPCALPAHATTGRLVLASFYFLLSALCFRAWGQYSIDWQTVDGGGGTSTGGVYAVSGTIGQPDAGAMSGGPFTLTGGFWSVIAAVQEPGAPLLSVTRTATNTVIVSWPGPATSWRLHATTSLAAAPISWTELPPPYQTSGTNISFTEPSPVGNKFYRLHKP